MKVICVFWVDSVVFCICFVFIGMMIIDIMRLVRLWGLDWMVEGGI